MLLTITEPTIVSTGFATRAGASRAAARADRTFYANVTLTVTERQSAEWARLGIEKAEYVITATPKEG